ncbi:hypothetical protein Kisp01_66400 [Kineosporia sp. NBRC 101677]|uniref:hypothetical protein n=1 Tax=Kineosporia sp. NBRC 101677 TaxID=3032197 RepID=UPI0024A54511|nr:hypothetical protein [Kineosporia sp. NBRC 101677]GLY19626.1 hypothetical protein Kisp01_66400 [Kineosporia sp. NBRC 101677]
MNPNGEVSISGGTFNNQGGAIAFGAGAEATSQVSQAAFAQQPLPEVLGADEIRLLRAQLAELQVLLAQEGVDTDQAGAVALQAGLVDQALTTSEPRRRTVAALVQGMAESAKALTAVGEFAGRLVGLVTTGTF